MDSELPNVSYLIKPSQNTISKDENVGLMSHISVQKENFILYAADRNIYSIKLPSEFAQRCSSPKSSFKKVEEIISRGRNWMKLPFHPYITFKECVKSFCYEPLSGKLAVLDEQGNIYIVAMEELQNEYVHFFIHKFMFFLFYRIGLNTVLSVI